MTMTTKTTLDSLTSPQVQGDLPTRYDRLALLDYIHLSQVAHLEADNAAGRGDRDLMKVCVLAKITADKQAAEALYLAGGLAAAW